MKRFSILFLLIFLWASIAAGSGMQPVGGITVAVSGADVTAPEFSSASLAADGETYTITLNENVQAGAGGSGGFVATGSVTGATAITVTDITNAVITGTGADVINSGETITLAYTQPTDGIQDLAENDLASFGPESVTNNSTQGGGSAIAVGATVSVQTDATAAVASLAHTVDANSELLLVFGGGYRGGGGIDYSCVSDGPVNGITWTADGQSGQAMTPLCPLQDGTWDTTTAMAIWYLVNPNPGDGDLTFGAGDNPPNSGATYIAVNVSHVNTTVGSSGIRDNQSSSATSGAATATLSSATGDLVIRINVADDTSIVSESGSTVEYGPTAYNNSSVSVSWHLSGGASYNATNTTTGDTYPGIFALSIASD